MIGHRLHVGMGTITRKRINRLLRVSNSFFPWASPILSAGADGQSYRNTYFYLTLTFIELATAIWGSSNQVYLLET